MSRTATLRTSAGRPNRAAAKGSATVSPLLAALRSRLIVSCQADEGMPMRSPSVLRALAATVLLGGASGLRLEGATTIRAVRQAVTPSVPIIGLRKLGKPPEVFITPTLSSVHSVLGAGADIVALDATARARPDGRGLAASVEAVHAAGRLALGDIATVDDAKFAQDAGVDAVATTLRGYTEATVEHGHLDAEFLARVCGHVQIPVFAEGHISTPDEAASALAAGAFAVIVGSAITRPEVITRRFAAAVANAPRGESARSCTEAR